jgi:4-amino-4-deoxy-L-arabinose transferase-like glycosyltransferase
VAFVVLFGDTLSLETSGYDAYAVNLLAGDGYTRFDDLHPDSDLPPLYAFFLAGVYRVFGRDARVVAAVQIVFDLATLALVYGIGRRVFGVWEGLAAAALTALYPYMLYQNLTVNDTAIFTCLLVLAVWLAYRAGDAASMRWAATTGAVLGLAALTKSLALLLVPLWGLWWMRRLGWRRGLRAAAVTTLAAALVIAPWVARNTALHGRFVFISTNGGSNLHQGNNACTASYLRAGWDVQWTGECMASPPSDLDEIELDRWHTRQALDYLRGDLGRAASLLGVKLLVLWSPAVTPYAVPPHLAGEVGQVLQYETTAFKLSRVVHVIYFGPLLALAAVGVVLARRRAMVFPVLAVFAAFTLTYMVTHPSTRYRMPIDPLLFIFSAAVLHYMWRRARASGRKRPTTLT